MNQNPKYPILDQLKTNALGGFIMPEGYFESLPEKTKTKILVNEKVNESLQVPDQYFEELSNKINSKIDEFEISSVDVPKNYFEKLSKSIFDKIENEEQKETPVLNSLSKNSGFSVPEGYFNDLNQNVISKIEEPKVVNLPVTKRENRFELLRWAAVIVLIMSSAWFVYNQYSNSSNINQLPLASLNQNETFEKIALQELDEETIINYIGGEVENKKENTNKTEKISEEEILQNIDINDLGDAL